MNCDLHHREHTQSASAALTGRSVSAAGASGQLAHATTQTLLNPASPASLKLITDVPKGRKNDSQATSATGLLDFSRDFFLVLGV